MEQKADKKADLQLEQLKLHAQSLQILKDFHETPQGVHFLGNNLRLAQIAQELSALEKVQKETQDAKINNDPPPSGSEPPLG